MSCNLHHFFYNANRVPPPLQRKKLTTPSFWWQSKFEFQLRLQEFVELVRADNNIRAIAYARKYLAPWGATHMKELQRVIATLAFKSSTECATYKVSFMIQDFFCPHHSYHLVLSITCLILKCILHRRITVHVR